MARVGTVRREEEERTAPGAPLRVHGPLGRIDPPAFRPVVVIDDEGDPPTETGFPVWLSLPQEPVDDDATSLDTPWDGMRDLRQAANDDSAWRAAAEDAPTALGAPPRIAAPPPALAMPAPRAPVPLPSPAGAVPGVAPSAAAALPTYGAPDGSTSDTTWLRRLLGLASVTLFAFALGGHSHASEPRAEDITWAPLDSITGELRIELLP